MAGSARSVRPGCGPPTARRLLQVLQYYYPETAHKMFIINTPFVFRTAWTMVRPPHHHNPYRSLWELRYGRYGLQRMDVYR